MPRVAASSGHRPASWWPEPSLDQSIGDSQPPHRRSVYVAPAPRWVAPAFAVMAAVLLPWIVFLGLTLPARSLSAHWRVAWVGFDIMLLVALASTAWFAYRRSAWVEVAATAAAGMLAMDAWFDVLTAAGGAAFVQALVSALVIELPLAALSLWIARHAVEVNERAARFLLARSARQAARLREDQR